MSPAATKMLYYTEHRILVIYESNKHAGFDAFLLHSTHKRDALQVEHHTGPTAIGMYEFVKME